MRQLLVLSWLLLPLVAAAQGKEKIVILQPASKITLAGQKESTTVYEAAARVVPKIEKLAKDKYKWPYFVVDYDEGLAAQKEAMGDRTFDGYLPVAMLGTIANKTGARYVVHSVVHEFTGARSARITAQRTGRIIIDILVYDAKEKKLVWQDSQSKTSTRTDWFADSSLREVQDQAFVNALKEGLDPFMDGQRKEIETQGVNVVATAKSVFESGKKVLLDIGSSVLTTTGVEMSSLDGKCKIKITEVLQNGSIAEVLEGTPEVGMVFKST
jgi:hypothetical protein